MINDDFTLDSGFQTANSSSAEWRVPGLASRLSRHCNIALPLAILDYRLGPESRARVRREGIESTYIWPSNVTKHRYSVPQGDPSQGRSHRVGVLQRHRLHRYLIFRDPHCLPRRTSFSLPENEPTFAFRSPFLFGLTRSLYPQAASVIPRRRSVSSCPAWASYQARSNSSSSPSSTLALGPKKYSPSAFARTLSRSPCSSSFIRRR